LQENVLSNGASKHELAGLLFAIGLGIKRVVGNKDNIPIMLSSIGDEIIIYITGKG
jgi:hypothetical protein